MAKRDKYRKKRSSDFLDYSSGKMSDRERHAFERRMQKDPFEADAADGFSRLGREEAEQDLQSVAGNIWDRIEKEKNRIGSKSSRGREIDQKRKIGRNRRIAWYSAAAAFASLMIVATVFFQLNNNGLERYETAPEMREAAKEHTAPLQRDGKKQETGMEQEEHRDPMPEVEVVVEQEEPMQEEPMQEMEVEQEEQEEPMQQQPMQEMEVEQDKREELMQARAVQKSLIQNGIAVEESGTKLKKPDRDEQQIVMKKEISEKGIAPKNNLKTDAAFPATTGQDTKKTNMPLALVVEESDSSESVNYRRAVPEKGFTNYRDYIDSVLVYPELESPPGKEVVVLKFSIAADGQPKNFHVVRAPDNVLFEKEAIRLISEGPPWHPATRNGQYIEKDVRLKIVFRKK